MVIRNRRPPSHPYPRPGEGVTAVIADRVGVHLFTPGLMFPASGATLVADFLDRSRVSRLRVVPFAFVAADADVGERFPAERFRQVVCPDMSAEAAHQPGAGRAVESLGSGVASRIRLRAYPTPGEGRRPARRRSVWLVRADRGDSDRRLDRVDRAPGHRRNSRSEPFRRQSSRPGRPGGRHRHHRRQVLRQQRIAARSGSRVLHQLWRRHRPSPEFSSSSKRTQQGRNSCGNQHFSTTVSVVKGVESRAGVVPVWSRCGPARVPKYPRM
jgi:hypothetical protein